MKTKWVYITKMQVESAGQKGREIDWDRRAHRYLASLFKTGQQLSRWSGGHSSI